MNKLYGIAAVAIGVIALIIISFNISETQNSTGILEGTVHFIGTNCFSEQQNIPPCSGPYPNYEIVIYASDGNTIVKKTTTNENGTYQINLDFDTYVIYEKKLQNNKQVDIPTEIQINSPNLAHDIIVDSGIR